MANTIPDPGQKGVRHEFFLASASDQACLGISNSPVSARCCMYRFTNLRLPKGKLYRAWLVISRESDGGLATYLVDNYFSEDVSWDSSSAFSTLNSVLTNAIDSNHGHLVTSLDPQFDDRAFFELTSGLYNHWREDNPLTALTVLISVNTTMLVKVTGENRFSSNEGEKSDTILNWYGYGHGALSPSLVIETY